MKSRNTLAAALAAGAMVAGLVPSSAPAKSAPTAIEEKQTRKRRQERRKRMTRRERIEELTRRSRTVGLGSESRYELAILQQIERMSRGRLGRRMRRGRRWGASATVARIRAGRNVAASRPSPRGERVPSSVRALILELDGLRVSGRQWKKLRKMGRRADRANGRRPARSA